MDELGGGPFEPLRDPHHEADVCMASSPKIRQSAWRAAECLSQIPPSETALLTLRVERGVELAKVPPKPTLWSRLRQPSVADVGA
jgi:hypothetical protein